jgi:hypothetical protein
MYAWLRSGLIRLCIPLSWSRGKEQVARSLRRFSSVEADSAWQMLQALRAIDDPELEESLFGNALEEVHHAYLFGRLARQYEHLPTLSDCQERTQLFDPARGTAHFEALHHVGEIDVYNQFGSYARAAGLPEIRELFLRLVGDEAGHQEVAFRQLVAIAGSEKKARVLVRSARIGRVLEALTRAGEAMGTVISGVILSALYLVFAPLALYWCRARFRRAGPAAPPSPAQATLQKSAVS